MTTGSSASASWVWRVSCTDPLLSRNAMLPKFGNILDLGNAVPVVFMRCPNRACCTKRATVLI